MTTSYNTCIGSYINYGSLMGEVKSNRIEVPQKKAIQLGQLKIYDIFKLKLLKFFYKLSCDILPPYFNSYHDVIDKEPPRILRQHFIHQPMIKRAYAECTHLYQLIKLA